MVIDMHTIKPIDKDIVRYAERARRLLQQNHNIINGLARLSPRCFGRVSYFVKRVGVKTNSARWALRISYAKV